MFIETCPQPPLNSLHASSGLALPAGDTNLVLTSTVNRTPYSPPPSPLSGLTMETPDHRGSCSIPLLGGAAPRCVAAVRPNGPETVLSVVRPICTGCEREGGEAWEEGLFCLSLQPPDNDPRRYVLVAPTEPQWWLGSGPPARSKGSKQLACTFSTTERNVWSLFTRLNVVPPWL